MFLFKAGIDLPGLFLGGSVAGLKGQKRSMKPSKEDILLFYIGANLLFCTKNDVN